MRIIIVGGAGDMGRVASRTIAADPATTSVTIADRDEDRARALAAELGVKAGSTGLDITDSAALQATLADVELVVNTVGPFYLYGPPALEAAIAAGVHYIDINDDWEPTVEMFRLHERAAAAGVTALVGMGASPGISNLLASAAHAELDSCDALLTVWRGGSGVPKAPETPDDVEPAAAIDHWIHNLADPIRIWRDGRFQQADALEERGLDFPGIGAATVWSCGHPEPISLPRTFPDVKHSVNAMFARPGLIDAARKVRDRVRSGELTVSEGSREFLLMPGRRGPEAGPVPDFPGVFAYAEGTKDGRPARVTVSTNLMPEGKMGEATCIPTAIAAGMLARGEIATRGVWGPEACVDPDTFFPRLAQFAGARSAQPPLDIRIDGFDAPSAAPTP